MRQAALKRQRRIRKLRSLALEHAKPRVCVHRTPRHIYAQVINAEGAHTVAAASTQSADIRDRLTGLTKTQAAKLVGEKVAELALEAGVTQVVFDRSGFRYHGRVAALADAAREKGLQF